MKKNKLFNELDQLGQNLFVSAVRKPRILTCPQGVVTYMMSQEDPDIGTVLQHVLAPKEIDDKIREILSTSPDIDLTQEVEIQKTLGITILTHKKTKSSSLPPDEDIFW